MFDFLFQTHVCYHAWLVLAKDIIHLTTMTHNEKSALRSFMAGAWGTTIDFQQEPNVKIDVSLMTESVRH